MTLGLKDLYYAVCTEADGADFVGTEESAAAKTWFTAVPEKAAAMESV